MARFVHLTPAANVPSIRRSGIRVSPYGPGGERGVYCFPVLPSFTLTHQWLRELARFNHRGLFTAVHVRLDDDEPVFTGYYLDQLRADTAAGAAGRIAALADPRGLEVFVPRAVAPREVRAVRAVPQRVGWRYWPTAHGRRPCNCYGCWAPGGYGARRLLERLPHPVDGPPPPPRVLLARVAAAGDPGDPVALRDALRWFALRRRGPLTELARLAEHPDPGVREGLACAVARWSTPGVDALLAGLADDPDPDVRETAGSIRETRADQ